MFCCCDFDSGVPPRAQYILSTCTAVLPVQNPEIRKSISSHDITTTQHIEYSLGLQYVHKQN
jgi:hypothetical protein